MGIRLQSTYYTEKDNAALLFLYDSSYSGSTTSFKAESLEISWRGDDAQERFSPIIGSELRLSMVVDTSTLETFITDLVGAEEGRFTVSFGAFIGGKTFAWNGYITTDNVRIEDTQLALGYRVEIRAVDGLGRLKDIDYNNAGTAYTGKETFVEHILNCLNKLDFVSDLYPAPTNILNVVCNWHEDSYTYASTINPLSRSRVSHGAFYYRDTKGNLIYSSCYKVLEEICRAWGARLMFSGSQFWFIQVNEMATPTAKTVFTYQTDGTEAVSASQDLSIIHTPGVAGNKILRFSGGAFEFFLPLKSVQVDYKHIQSRNLIAGKTWQNTDTSTFTTEVVESNGNTARIFLSGKFQVTSNYPLGGGYFESYRNIFKIKLVVNLSYGFVRNYSTNDGNPTYTTPEWEDTAVPTVEYYYVIGPEISTSDPASYVLDVAILTDFLPDTGAVTISVDYHDSFETIDGTPLGLEGDPPPTYEPDWVFSESYMEYLYEGTFASQSDIYRYLATNNGGASKRLELTNIIGDGPNLNSPGHIEVQDDADEWVISDAWRVGNSGTYKAHSQLLCNEIIRGQLTPVKKFAGQSFQNLDSPANPLLPHLAISYDSAYWLLLSGTFNVKTEIFSGDWFKLQTASGYTESSIQLIPSGSASGPPTAGSTTGGGSTTLPGGSTGVVGGGSPGVQSVTIYREEFLAQSSDTFTVTENGGAVPTAPAQVQVYMNGQKLLPVQYSISGSDVTIDAGTHISGANYEIYFTIIN